MAADPETQTRVLARRPDALWRTTDLDVLVRADGVLHHLGGPAAVVWLVLEQPTGLDQLAQVFLRESAGHLEVVDLAVGNRVERLVEQLVDLGIVRWEPHE